MNLSRYIYRSKQYIFKCSRTLDLFSNSNVCVQKSRNFSKSHSMEKQKESFLIVGLGNHDYPRTRHSVGMLLIDRLAGFLEMSLVKRKDCLGFVAAKHLSDIHLILLKPKLAMNINGTSVRKAASVFQVERDHIYLVHDDLDKKLGASSIKERGSAGGHNGVKSVMQKFQNQEIARLRIGIDRPATRSMVEDYVLEKFTAEERAVIDEKMNAAILKIAKHIGARLEIPPARVFRVNSREENGASTSAEVT